MDGLLGTTQQALQLLLTGNPELWTIVGISFSVSLKAIVFTTPVALVLAFVLAYVDFPGNRLLLSMFNSLLSVPTVVVGLLLYMLLSRQGPLGDLKLLFTQTAMVVAQMVLCFP
ncbi:MAG: ABC transporter permease, partial [SAR324 cluster bacterium]|nr:ABC transporter permease [SAR324 cluster bacterium]